MGHVMQLKGIHIDVLCGVTLACEKVDFLFIVLNAHKFIKSQLQIKRNALPVLWQTVFIVHNPIIVWYVSVVLKDKNIKVLVKINPKVVIATVKQDGTKIGIYDTSANQIKSSDVFLSYTEKHWF